MELTKDEIAILLEYHLGALSRRYQDANPSLWTPEALASFQAASDARSRRVAELFALLKKEDASGTATP